MRIVGTDLAHAFCQRHADGRSWIANWLAEMRAASWRTPADLKLRYPSASILPGNTVIFNVRGNEYRLEIQISFAAQVVRVVWIGTHAEYSKRHK